MVILDSQMHQNQTSEEIIIKDAYPLDGLFDMLGPAMSDTTTSLTMCNDLDEYLEMQTNFLDSITNRPKK